MLIKTGLNGHQFTPEHPEEDWSFLISTQEKTGSVSGSYSDPAPEEDWSYFEQFGVPGC